jgi:hypothetical protein
MSKICLNDTTESILVKMSEGNPGALNVLVSVLENGSKIDPQDAFQGLGCILTLDNNGVYGSKIWMLFKDVCKCNISHTIAMVRAVQLGFLSGSKLNEALSKDYATGIFDVPSYVEKVKGRLSGFCEMEG